MFEHLHRISKQSDWEYFPVYTGEMSMKRAFEHFENTRKYFKENDKDKEMVNKLRMIPCYAKDRAEYDNLTYLPYILILDAVIEISGAKNRKLHELEKIRDWFRDYIILKDEEATNE